MSFSPDSSTTAGRGANLTTPTGAHGQAMLGRRRRLVIVLNVATYLILMAVASVVIDGLGWTAAGIVWLRKRPPKPGAPRQGRPRPSASSIDGAR
jgi:hypothetical protein